MPAYHFLCRDCGARIEINQRITDALPVTHIDADEERSCGGTLDWIPQPTSFTISGYRASNSYSADK